MSVEITEWHRVKPKWQFWNKDEMAHLYCENEKCDWYATVKISDTSSFVGLQMSRAAIHANICEYNPKPKPVKKTTKKKAAAKKPVKKAVKK